MTNEQRAAYIKDLLKERAAYERRGNSIGVQEVDDELRKIGAASDIPVRAAEKRPAAKRTKEKR